MAKDIMMPTSRASLCALGEYLRRQCFFAPLREQVQIPQKTVRYRPIDVTTQALQELRGRGHSDYDASHELSHPYRARHPYGL